MQCQGSAMGSLLANGKSKDFTQTDIRPASVGYHRPIKAKRELHVCYR
ncbi:hypothetical protein VCR6J2_470096 [Vibrio coralliirubri]|nr:hypothetical protein VCR6J2_470096 [Vibrio coralliirubri]